MRGWRSKLITLMVIYSAGFATAIYVMAPTPTKEGQPTPENAVTRMGFDFHGSELTDTVKVKLDKTVQFTQEQSKVLGEFISSKNTASQAPQ